MRRTRRRRRTWASASASRPAASSSAPFGHSRAECGRSSPATAGFQNSATAGGELLGFGVLGVRKR